MYCKCVASICTNNLHWYTMISLDALTRCISYLFTDKKRKEKLSELKKEIVFCKRVLLLEWAKKIKLTLVIRLRISTLTNNLKWLGDAWCHIDKVQKTYQTELEFRRPDIPGYLVLVLTEGLERELASVYPAPDWLDAGVHKS